LIKELSHILLLSSLIQMLSLKDMSANALLKLPNTLLILPKLLLKQKYSQEF